MTSSRRGGMAKMTRKMTEGGGGLKTPNFRWRHLWTLPKNKYIWRLVSKVTERNQSFCGLTEGGSVEGRLVCWTTHFVRLIARSIPRCIWYPDITQDHPITHLCRKLYYGWAKTGYAYISEGRSCGEYGITTEVLKWVEIDAELLQFYNNALHIEGRIPDHWKQLLIAQVPKKGGLTKTDNYRGIALTSVMTDEQNTKFDDPQQDYTLHSQFYVTTRMDFVEDVILPVTS